MLSYHCALSNTTNFAHHSHQTPPASRIGCLLQLEHVLSECESHPFDGFTA